MQALTAFGHAGGFRWWNKQTGRKSPSPAGPQDTRGSGPGAAGPASSGGGPARPGEGRRSRHRLAARRTGPVSIRRDGRVPLPRARPCGAPGSAAGAALPGLRSPRAAPAPAPPPAGAEPRCALRRAAALARCARSSARASARERLEVPVGHPARRWRGGAARPCTAWPGPCGGRRPPGGPGGPRRPGEGTALPGRGPGAGGWRWGWRWAWRRRRRRAARLTAGRRLRGRRIRCRPLGASARPSRGAGTCCGGLRCWASGAGGGPGALPPRLGAHLREGGGGLASRSRGLGEGFRASVGGPGGAALWGARLLPEEEEEG